MSFTKVKNMTQISSCLYGWIGILLFFAVSIGGCADAGEITVGITNNSDRPIQYVVAKYTGGTMRVGPVAIGERQMTAIKPTGDSHIELDIHPVNGEVEHRSVDTYFGYGYRGNIEITLSKGFAVQSVEQLSGR